LKSKVVRLSMAHIATRCQAQRAKPSIRPTGKNSRMLRTAALQMPIVPLQ
jgi:hypothetical protein